MKTILSSPHDVSIWVTDGALEQDTTVDADGHVARQLGEHHLFSFAALKHGVWYRKLDQCDNYVDGLDR